MGVGGKAIPPYIDKITDISSDAEFILLVEKEAAFMRIAEDRFYNKVSILADLCTRTVVCGRLRCACTRRVLIIEGRTLQRTYNAALVASAVSMHRHHG